MTPAAVCFLQSSEAYLLIHRSLSNDHYRRANRRAALFATTMWAPGDNDVGTHGHDLTRQVGSSVL